MTINRRTNRVQVVVIGAGQSGLSVGYFLSQLGVSFVILDAHARVGDTWRHRWDSLRLFTPAKYDGLAGMPFPAAPFSFPTKDEMADYLEAYATRFNLPLRNNVTVDRVWRDGERYVVETSADCYEADHVVVAMATYQKPRVPEIAKDLDPDIVQLHSYDYRNPAQLKPGGVLIVGAGNSGADIALEVAKTHQTWLAGRDVGHVPFRIESAIAKVLIPILFRLVFHRVLTVATPLGRRARRAAEHGGALIRVKPADLEAAHVRRTGRFTAVRNGGPVLEDGQALDVANVIWSTGFETGLSWIDIPLPQFHGAPAHNRGIMPDEPGLYFVGQFFLYAFSSTMIHGVERDARRVATTIHTRLQAGLQSLTPRRTRRARRSGWKIFMSKPT